MEHLSSQSDHDKSAEIAERSVCSILLFAPARIEEARALGADSGQFFDRRYGGILRAIFAKHDAGERVEPTQVHACMAEHGTAGWLTAFGDVAFLLDLQNEAIGPDGLEGYIRVVQRAHYERQARERQEALKNPHPSEATRQRTAQELVEVEQRIAALHLAAAGWPDPLPLPEGLPPVPAMTADMLPPSIQGWLSDIAERMQCPLEFPAVAALVGMASLIGRKLAICPKQLDDWKEVCNLWGWIIGLSGFKKTHPMKEVLAPIHRLQSEARKQYDKDHADDEVNAKIARARSKGLEAKIAAQTKEDPDADLGDLCDALRNLEVKVPSVQRYVTHDPTIEKLSVLLADNPRGLLLYRDELQGWLRTMERDGHEGDRAFYLECWTGKGDFSSDRMTREVAPPPLCLSVIGGIQPGPVAEYIRATLRSGRDDDGFVQRFQLAVYPDLPQRFEWVDRSPDKAARDRAYEVFRRLDKFEPIELAATEDPETGLWFLRFAPDAQEKWSAYYVGLQCRLRSKSGVHPVMHSHLSKFDGLSAKLALLFHVIECVNEGTGGPVRLAAAELAIRWCAFLEAHAARIYGSVINPEHQEARELADRILRGQLTDRFSARDIYRKEWKGLATTVAAQRAIDRLVELHWLRSNPVQTGGRGTCEYTINPKLPRTPTAKPAKTDKSPPLSILSTEASRC